MPRISSLGGALALAAVVILAGTVIMLRATQQPDPEVERGRAILAPCIIDAGCAGSFVVSEIVPGKPYVVKVVAGSTNDIVGPLEVTGNYLRSSSSMGGYPMAIIRELVGPSSPHWAKTKALYEKEVRDAK